MSVGNNGNIKEKGRIQKFQEEHPLIFSTGTSILASVILGVVEPIQNIKVSFSVFPIGGKQLSFTIPLYILIGLIVGVGIFCGIQIWSRLQKKDAKCDECNKISRLREEVEQAQTSEKNLKSQIEEKEELIQKFQKAIEAVDVAASIQIFQIATNEDEVQVSSEYVTITVKCQHSFQQRDANVNCMQQMLFHLKKKYYDKVKELSHKYNEYFLILMQRKMLGNTMS